MFVIILEEFNTGPVAKDLSNTNHIRYGIHKEWWGGYILPEKGEDAEAHVLPIITYMVA